MLKIENGYFIANMTLIDFYQFIFLTSVIMGIGFVIAQVFVDSLKKRLTKKGKIGNRGVV